MSEIVAKKLQELANLRRNILAGAPEAALDAILNQKQPEILVQSFNPEDLHILIQEIGADDALPLIQMASDAQWEYMLDMESWSNDRLDLQAVAAWLRYLFLADADRFVKQALNDNLELVEVWLQHNIEVVIRGDDEDLSYLNQDYFTLDDTFYVRVKPAADQSMPDSMSNLDRTQFIRDFLNRLADEDYAKYQGLLMESSALLGTEIEEELYRIKTGRLEEKGIPSFENALAIYTMLPLERLTKRQTLQSDFRLNPPILPEVLADNQPRPIPDLSPATLTLPDDFAQEFASLVNSILVADQIKIDARKSMRQAVSKAMDYLRIAIETLEHEQKLTPLQAAHMYAAGQLFTFGFSQALKLKWQAQAWLKQSFIVKNKLGLKFYAEDGAGLLSGLFLKRPLYFDNYRQGNMYREFSTRADVDQTAAALNEIRAVDALLLKTGLTLAGGRYHDENYPLTWKNLLLTLWLRHELGYAANLQAVALAALQDFWPLLFSEGQLKTDAELKFSAWLKQSSQTVTLEEAAINAIHNLFKELEQHYARITLQNIDAKLITLFRIINA